QATAQRAAEEIDRAREALAARLGGEHALVAQVKAELASALLDLSFTKVHAPCDGIVSDLQLRLGAYVRAGEPALTVIAASHWVVVANFTENSLLRMQAGQPALVALRSSPGELFTARVETLGRGVAEGQGSPSGRLPAIKPRTSWVQPAQRFQVRLVLT